MQFITKAELSRVEPKELFNSGHIKVVDINGYHSVMEGDMVICIPYLVEQNSIMIRYEEVPTYELIQHGIEKYIVAMSETFKDGEQPIDALKRGLKEEFGIALKDSVQPEILTPLFASKGNTARYHICILPLMSTDFEQIIPEGDGTEHEMRAHNVSVNIAELNNLIIYDLITRYCIDLFKKYYSLF